MNDPINFLNRSARGNETNPSLERHILREGAGEAQLAPLKNAARDELMNCIEMCQPFINFDGRTLLIFKNPEREVLCNTQMQVMTNDLNTSLPVAYQHETRLAVHFICW